MGADSSSESLRRQACSLIRQMIVDGDLSPGQPVVELDLAARFQMSRAPIREALVELEKEGLIRRIGSRTRVVAEVTIEDMIEIHEMREMIEGMSARLFAARVTDRQLDELREMAKAIDVPNKLDEVELAFHDYIIRECGNSRLAHFAALANPQLVHMQIRDLLIRRNKLPSVLQLGNGTLHAEIVDALATRDPNKAEEAARAHIRENKNMLLNCVLGRSQ